MAVCLLAETAYENIEDFRPHLPQLLHAILLLMDSPEPIVFQHAQQVGCFNVHPKTLTPNFPKSLLQR